MAATKRRRRASAVIRPLEPADIDRLADIYRQPSVVAGTLQLPHQSTDELRARWSAQDPQRRVLVAELGGTVVGMAAVHRLVRARRAHVADVGVVVSEQVRGKGVGGALVDGLVEIAERWMGVLRLELTVWVDNRPAIALYRSRGFEIEGAARAFALRDGVVVDAFHMARVSKALPWPRLTAEEAAGRAPPQLTPGFDPTAN